MAAYVDYEYYINEFGGAAISEDDFHGLSIRASREVDLITMGRIAGTEWEQSQAVKNAICATAEVIHSDDIRQTTIGFVASETTGRVSVSYQTAEPLKTQIYEVAKSYLFPTGLLYRGCGCAHKHRCNSL